MVKKAPAIDSAAHEKITLALRERVSARDARIDDLRRLLAEQTNTANVRGDIILELRNENAKLATTIETLCVQVANQRDTLLSDAQWIADASSKLRNQDSVIASQAHRIETLCVQAENLSAKRTDEQPDVILDYDGRGNVCVG
jgi:hypothetical protein